MIQRKKIRHYHYNTRKDIGSYEIKPCNKACQYRCMFDVETPLKRSRAEPQREAKKITIENSSNENSKERILPQDLCFLTRTKTPKTNKLMQIHRADPILSKNSKGLYQRKVAAEHLIIDKLKRAQFQKAPCWIFLKPQQQVWNKISTSVGKTLLLKLQIACSIAARPIQL